MDMGNVLLSFVGKSFADLSLGRMVEGFVIFYFVWKKVSPHLTKIEERLAGLESAVSSGFNSGEQRFTRIEGRLDALETNPKEGKNGNHQQAIIT